jgi:DNA-directed RNA polymerase subunit K/omega
MIYPTIHDLTKGNFNRYELAIATAKCARLITDEYVRQREAAEKHLANNKESDKPMISMIDSEYRDEKAVKVAINHIYAGDYTLLHADEVEALEAEREAAAHAIAQESASEEAEAQELPALTDADDDIDADDDTAADESEADEQDEIAAE